jgi:hypothetical protein
VVYSEARVRYILTDVTLGGPLSYYRDRSYAPDPAEAVHRWDLGVRVLNVDQFERKIVNGQWTIVYKGTNQRIDGMDVILNTDQQEGGTSLLSTGSFEVLSIDPVEGLC